MINEQFIDRVMGVLLEMRLDEKNRETRDELDKRAAKRLKIKGNPTKVTPAGKAAKAELRKTLLKPSDYQGRDAVDDDDGNTEPKERILSIQKTKRDRTKGWIKKNKEKAAQSIKDRIEAVETSRENRPNLPR